VAVTPVSSATSANSATSAYGLDFQSLLQIVLDELTYQDPLNPVSNYEFVSQLGQFSQLQLSETLNTDMTQLLATQSAVQATSLLGQAVDVNNNGTVVSGQVTSIAFSNGTPTLTLTTSTGQTVANLSIADIVQVTPNSNSSTTSTGQ
jgi:flagellar basal-body rod modification protein FlgD